VEDSYCTSRSNNKYTNGWVVDFTNEKCIQDCDPAAGYPCSEHNNHEAKIYSTTDECCQRLGWVDRDLCQAKSLSNSLSIGRSNKYFADYATGRCFQDCDPALDGCALVPPPVNVYPTIEVCCSKGLSWVEDSYCTSRSNNKYTNGWVVDFTNEKCIQDCDPAAGYPCSEHNNHEAKIYSTTDECCQRLGWVDRDLCISDSSGPNIFNHR